MMPFDQCPGRVARCRGSPSGPLTVTELPKLGRSPLFRDYLNWDQEDSGRLTLSRSDLGQDTWRIVPILYRSIAAIEGSVVFS
jgi:hypothetical protein